MQELHDIPRRAVLVAALSLVAACGDDDSRDHDAGAAGASGAGCMVLTDESLDCSPSFDPPDFAAVYDNVLEPRCGSPGTGMSCHGPDGQQAGVVLWEPDVAYESLLNPLSGPARVVPGHPECSELVRRLESDDPRVRMPLMDDRLAPGMICAVKIWIAEGAEGP